MKASRKTSKTRKAPTKARKTSTKSRRWSRRVTQTSDALTLEARVFTRSPAEIARSLKRSAERSRKRKTTPFRSAMSMLNFYENRAGKNLPASARHKLDRAKTELRKLFGRPDPPRPRGGR